MAARVVSPHLIRPQAQFLATPARFRAYVAGFGAGKTWAGCAARCLDAWEHPQITTGYFAPTYPQIRDIYYPTIEEVAHDWGLEARVRLGDKEVELYEGRRFRGLVICRSMEKPESIVGFKIARAMVDEIDVMSADKAQRSWRKIIARLRLKFGGLNGVDLCTTPEGYKFTYEQFVKAPREDAKLAQLYALVQASTYENEANLPEGYIDSLRQTYPANLIQAYLHGEFVNLTQGSVYINYNRADNRSRERIQPGEPLFVGMDFNIGRMAAVIHVKRDGQPHAVEEVIDAYDTPDIIRILKERYWQYIDGQYRKTHELRIYPDSSGQNRTRMGAGINDIQLLREAGFLVSAPSANPPVRDRVISMNALFCNAQGVRRYFVNDDTCPTYAENLEQQAYDEKGEPDKKSGKDHSNDAAGYFIHRDYPLRKPARKINLGVAM